MLASTLPLTTMTKLVPVPPLPSLEDDVLLEEANQSFWTCLLGHIRAEWWTIGGTVLDVGCHKGGLLVKLSEALKPRRIFGIEPLAPCRERANFRLRKMVPDVFVYSPRAWHRIPNSAVDLITCHEVLHHVEDLTSLFDHISRVLTQDGMAFVVAGCHTENPVWSRWREQLQASGQIVYSRSPLEIMRAGLRAGLRGALRPLRRDGWVFYDPDRAVFTYSSVEELCEHQYRHKLLFRFVKQ